jgi:hypothetical protein
MPRQTDAGGVPSTLRPQSFHFPSVSDLGKQLCFSSTAYSNASLYDGRGGPVVAAAVVADYRLSRS